MSTTTMTNIGPEKQATRQYVSELVYALWWMAVIIGTLLFGVPYTAASIHELEPFASRGLTTDWLRLLQENPWTPFLTAALTLFLTAIPITFYFGRKAIAKAKAQDQAQQQRRKEKAENR